MRYIELQRALQSRLAELERLCERERSILMGRWKTHSLPARKRTPTGIAGPSPGQPSPSSSFNSSTVQCCRPATSTEHLLLYSVVSTQKKPRFPHKERKYDPEVISMTSNFIVASLPQSTPSGRRNNNSHLLNFVVQAYFFKNAQFLRRETRNDHNLMKFWLVQISSG